MTNKQKNAGTEEARVALLERFCIGVRGRGAGGGFGVWLEHALIHARDLPSFQQPAFQTFTTNNVVSAAWSAFHLKRVIIMLVLSDIMKWRLLKCLLDHAMTYACVVGGGNVLKPRGLSNPSPCRTLPGLVYKHTINTTHKHTSTKLRQQLN